MKKGFQEGKIREKIFSWSGAREKLFFRGVVSALLGQVLWYLDDVSEP